MMIADTAARVVANVASIAARAGLNLGAVATTKELLERVATLRQAVEAAIAKDEAEARSFWIEMRELFENPFTYADRKREFESSVASLKHLAETYLNSIETFTQEVDRRAADAPERLDALATRFDDVRGAVSLATQGIGGLRSVEGWRGPSASGYQLVNDVQHSATVELEGMAASTSAAWKAVANLNRAIFRQMADEVRDAASDVRRAPGSVGQSYFRRTAASIQILTRLSGELVKLATGRDSRAAVDSLDSTCAEAIKAPAHIRPGTWPTGGAGASVAPADTTTVPDPDAQTVSPGAGSASPPVSAGGVQR